MRDARIQSLHPAAPSERRIMRVSEQHPASAGGQILQQHAAWFGSGRDNMPETLTLLLSAGQSEPGGVILKPRRRAGSA